MIRQDTDGLWAITSYFNPLGYRRRRENYRVFRNHLPVPLVTIELAYGPNFELCGEDAEILVQLRGRDILWQKERLLNQALQSLPNTCRKVAWLDCDVIFEAGDWAERTSRLLDRFPLVQPFSHLFRMPRGWLPDLASADATDLLRSIPRMIVSGIDLPTCLGIPAEQIKCATGAAWAAPRALLDQHQLYDACIVGGGDSAVARAAYGCAEYAIRLQHMNNERKEHYLAWARPFCESVRGEIAHVEGNLFHLWHGRWEDRRYRGRNEDFSRFSFDPFADIAIDANGAWRWNSDKHEMHDFVRVYFASRKEDGP